MMPGKSCAPTADESLLALAPIEKSSITGHVDPSQQNINFNLSYDQLGVLLLVLLIPIPKTQSHRGCPIKNWALWKMPLDKQYNSFHRFGYAADPSGDVANNIIGIGELATINDINSVYNLWQSEHHKQKAQRKAEKKEDQSDEEMDAETVENIQNPAFELLLLKNSAESLGLDDKSGHINGPAFVEQLEDDGADIKSAYGKDDEATSLSFWEMSEEDRDTSWETKSKEPMLVKVKLPCYMHEDVVVAIMNEEQGRVAELGNEDMQVTILCGTMIMMMLVKVAVESAFIEEQVQGFPKKNRVVVAKEEEQVEEDGTQEALDAHQREEQLQLPMDCMRDALDTCSLERYSWMMMLNGDPYEVDGTKVPEDARVECMAGKEESKDPKMELPVLHVRSMIGSGNSQVGAKLLKEVYVWWLNGMVINAAVQKAIDKVQDLLEEDLILYGLERGHGMFNVNDDVHLESGDAFDGAFLEVGSLSMDVGSSESMLMVAYVDGWLDAQEVGQPT
ncbi:hypothetical protein L7F22_005973 [Adiantum nelumboides]|nr:hypothetical protein [Adiantum nelumboides]